MKAGDQCMSNSRSSSFFFFLFSQKIVARTHHSPGHVSLQQPWTSICNTNQNKNFNLFGSFKLEAQLGASVCHCHRNPRPNSFMPHHCQYKPTHYPNICSLMVSLPQRLLHPMKLTMTIAHQECHVHALSLYLTKSFSP